MESANSILDKDSKLDGQMGKRKNSHWEHLLSQYEKKNATLEKRQAALAERVKFMECALPSLLMGTVIDSSQEPEKSRSSSKTRDKFEKDIAEKNITDNKS